MKSLVILMLLVAGILASNEINHVNNLKYKQDMHQEFESRCFELGGVIILPDGYCKILDVNLSY